jgi:nucleoside-diphosphate-sugar epimerase
MAAGERRSVAERVIVTGGSGKAGRAVVADLTDHGFAVTSVDVADTEPTTPDPSREINTLDSFRSSPLVSST